MKKIVWILMIVLSLVVCVSVLAEESEEHEEYKEPEEYKAVIDDDVDDMDTDDIVAAWNEMVKKIKELEGLITEKEAKIAELEAASAESSDAVQQIEQERDGYLQQVTDLEVQVTDLEAQLTALKEAAAEEAAKLSPLTETMLVWVAGGWTTDSLVRGLEEPQDDLRYFAEVGLRAFDGNPVSFAIFVGKSREAVFGGADLLLLRKGFLLGVGPFCTYDENSRIVVFPSLSLRYKMGSTIEPSVRVIMTSPHDIVSQIGFALTF